MNTLTQMQDAATNRVNQSDALRPYAPILLFEWNTLPGFKPFDKDKYLRWLSTDGSEQDIVHAMEMLCGFADATPETVEKRMHNYVNWFANVHGPNGPARRTLRDDQ